MKKSCTSQIFSNVPDYHISRAWTGINTVQEHSWDLACPDLVLCDKGYRGNWSVLENRRVNKLIMEMKSKSNSA